MTALPFFQNDFTLSEFASRRARIADQIPAGSAAILAGASADGVGDVFRQTNDFYYLCGVEVPHAYLRIEADSGRTTLYLPKCDPKMERSEGAVLHGDNPELTAKITGVDDVRLHDALEADLQGHNKLFLPMAPPEGRQTSRDGMLHAEKQISEDPWDDRLSRPDHFRGVIEAAHPAAEFGDLSPMLDRMRLIKSPAEIVMMREAGRLIALGVTEAMRMTQPGMMEYQIAAAADAYYTLGGARGPGYRPILASGSNIWNAHYFRNNAELIDGDLVLMDYAPDLRNYTSDIGRYWPVNGTFSPVQRELYGFIVEYHKVLLEKIRPGEMPRLIMAEVADVMRPRVAEHPWSKPEHAKAAEKALDFQGHLSHAVGMCVHDVGIYNYFDEPLAPGIVFAVDPQMWVPEFECYIRVEDTVVVTEDGNENFTELAPLELDDVEATMRESSIFDGIMGQFL